MIEYVKYAGVGRFVIVVSKSHSLVLLRLSFVQGYGRIEIDILKRSLGTVCRTLEHGNPIYCVHTNTTPFIAHATEKIGRYCTMWPAMRSIQGSSNITVPGDMSSCPGLQIIGIKVGVVRDTGNWIHSQKQAENRCTLH